MKKYVLCFVFALMTVSGWAQEDPIVMTVNGVPVPRSEFEYSFNKNNSDEVIDKKSIEEYVDLFINYKLKVAAALDEQMDTLSSFKQEFAMYRDQQVRPTLVAEADVLAEARRAYDRTKEAIGPRGLIQPAHIFLRLSISLLFLLQTILHGFILRELKKLIKSKRDLSLMHLTN